MNPHRYCVVMCGGVGTRFWPFSRSSMPKQFLDFFGTGRSLLQMTVDRIRSLVDPSRIILVTNSAYASIIREQLPDIKESNILLEPARRNTAPCLCWAARHIQALDSEASIVALPSDHLILKEDVFRQTLEDGFDFVEKGDRLLTLGLNPTAPATGYGYIQRGGFPRTKIAPSEVSCLHIYIIRLFHNRIVYGNRGGVRERCVDEIHFSRRTVYPNSGIEYRCGLPVVSVKGAKDTVGSPQEYSRIPEELTGGYKDLCHFKVRFLRK